MGFLTVLRMDQCVHCCFPVCACRGLGFLPCNWWSVGGVIGLAVIGDGLPPRRSGGLVI